MYSILGATPGSISNQEGTVGDLPLPPHHLPTESRTPTPKMLLNAKNGTLHWPVYQVGGTPGSGMLISTSSMLQLKKSKPDLSLLQPGRENFLLGEQISENIGPKPRVSPGKLHKNANVAIYFAGYTFGILVNSL